MFASAKDRESPRVLVIGLDCAEPSLVFDKWRDDLPVLRGLMRSGAYGQLSSSIPCITVPAWSSMLSGMDPGVLGFYGFRNRADRSYDRMRIATSTAMTEPRVWDLLSERGLQSIVVGVPQTYPIQPLRGLMISSFLTPSTSQQYTYPNELRHEVDMILEGEQYELDVRNFRTEDKRALLKQIQEMTRKRFMVLNHLIREKPWDLFMFVEMGVDRIHHGFWRFHDPDHRLHEPSNPYEHAIYDYYLAIDRGIGELLKAIDEETLILVVSDHGAKRMDGGFCLNQWLMQEGYLRLEAGTTGNEIRPLDETQVDWGNTIAWGAGGYYGRIWINMKGREPDGTVMPEDFNRVRDEIADRIEELNDPYGQPMGNICHRPEETYLQVNGIAPDLLVYFGDLHWRSIGSLGHSDIFTHSNDTGPDDANHAQAGLIIANEVGRNLGARRLQGLNLMDVAPTILGYLQQPIPSRMQGTEIAL